MHRRFNGEDSVKMDTEIFSVIMKFLNLKDIYSLLIPLNKEINKVVSSENYTLFKKFLAYYSLDSRLKRNALPA